MLWTAVFTYPLMAGIQMISARIGRVSCHGISSNICQHYPAWLLYIIVGLLLIANTINIAANIAAMADALKLLMGGCIPFYAIGIGLLSLLLQIPTPTIAMYAC